MPQVLKILFLLALLSLWGCLTRTLFLGASGREGALYAQSAVVTGRSSSKDVSRLGGESRQSSQQPGGTGPKEAIWMDLQRLQRDAQEGLGGTSCPTLVGVGG